MVNQREPLLWFKTLAKRICACSEEKYKVKKTVSLPPKDPQRQPPGGNAQVQREHKLLTAAFGTNPALLMHIFQNNHVHMEAAAEPAGDIHVPGLTMLMKPSTAFLVSQGFHSLFKDAKSWDASTVNRNTDNRAGSNLRKPHKFSHLLPQGLITAREEKETLFKSGQSQTHSLVFCHDQTVTFWLQKELLSPGSSLVSAGGHCRFQELLLPPPH
ncbi:uncharacterized protein LOC141943924 isoform X1 [Strix uralensis]|uniref:uncharacterized protein LOC141943924 isoform X1 n=1 Tax=Strix uralensis TaxID=36305 RepID=UPI003DA7081E